MPRKTKQAELAAEAAEKAKREKKAAKQAAAVHQLSGLPTSNIEPLNSDFLAFLQGSPQTAKHTTRPLEETHATTATTHTDSAQPTSADTHLPHSIEPEQPTASVDQNVPQLPRVAASQNATRANPRTGGSLSSKPKKSGVLTAALVGLVVGGVILAGYIIATIATGGATGPLGVFILPLVAKLATPLAVIFGVKAAVGALAGATVGASSAIAAAGKGVVNFFQNKFGVKNSNVSRLDSAPAPGQNPAPKPAIPLGEQTRRTLDFGPSSYAQMGDEFSSAPTDEHNAQDDFSGDSSSDSEEIENRLNNQTPLTIKPRVQPRTTQDDIQTSASTSHSGEEESDGENASQARSCPDVIGQRPRTFSM